LADGVNIGLVKIPPFPKIVEVLHTNKWAWERFKLGQWFWEFFKEGMIINWIKP
jgi:hypothetical protein